jgi:enediyne biosynthesis protein E4
MTRVHPPLIRWAAIVAALLVTAMIGRAESSSELSWRPLAPRSGPRGPTMFFTVPPEQSGLRADNPYDDPKMWGEHYREFVLGAIGTGIAIGDYDGDGLPDIFVVSKTGPNHLFRNLGGLRFEDVTDRAGVGGPTDAWKQGAAFADVNNDGRLDLYVCRFAAPNLLYINQGDGTFKEEAAARGLAVNDASSMAAFCDYDRDGWLDVYVLTNILDVERHPNGQPDYLFHNNGDGTFTNVTAAAGFSGETQCHGATWWDYNEDGWPDLYVDNDFKDPDQLYRNNGDGTFTNVLSWVVPHTPHSSMGADLGDVNNDGHIDLMVADMARTSRFMDQRGIALVRSGLMEDIQRPEAAPQYMRNALFVNTGAGRMLEAACLTGLDATDWTWSVRFEDLDNDGRLDVHFTNGMVRDLQDGDLLARMQSRESMAERIAIMKASPPLAEQHLAFRNLGDLHFENVSSAWGLDQVGVGSGAAFGDLDGDGDLDIVYASQNGNVILLRNDSDSGHRVLIDLRGTVSNRFGVGAIVRLETAAGVQVRDFVLARGYASTSEPVVHFGLGDADRIQSLVIAWPSGITQTFRDLPADRRYTVTEPAGPRPRLNPAATDSRRPAGQFTPISPDQGLAIASPEPRESAEFRQPLLPIRHSRPGPGAAVADVDGDGEDDLCVGGVEGGRAQLLSNLGGGQFMPAGSTFLGAPTGTADAAPLLFDINGDGFADLLLPKGGDARLAGDPAYQPQLFLNNGRGEFQPAPDGALPPLPVSAGAAVAADFNRDGRLDLFIGGRLAPGRYPEVPISALLENRGGTFVDVTDALAPALRRVGLVTAALWTDVDGDGWVDLLVATEWGTIHYFHNQAGRGFEDWSDRAGFSAAGRGWWNSLCAADLNGDGRLDYIAGNLGLNTMYRASPDHPAVLFYGDLDGSGRPLLLEAQYEGDALYPVRGRNVLAAVMPELRRRFPTYESYARATVDQVFAPERLARAERLTATEFRSGVFLSQSDGAQGDSARVTYRFVPLPRLAQIAPIYGVVAGDFDGDGFADVYAVQNSFAPLAEIGRFDGGLSCLLRGDGTGQLTPVPLTESGLMVPRDAKALAVADFDHDGWPDFFVTRNNDVALAFHNGGQPGRHSFAVALRGSVGNPTAIGAQIRVTSRDGRSQLGEVAAGSGYLSQSTAALFFGYTDANPPVEIRVRWPDGRTSTHPWSSANRRLTLVEPSP